MQNEKSLMDEKNLMDKKYKSCKDIDFLGCDIPNEPGVYCVRLNDFDADTFPKTFIKILKDINPDILYIGIATKSLKQRLNQELRAKGHGTFFRSLGAILGYKPRENSLDKKKKDYNYKFSEDDDKKKIIKWIDEHLSVNWIEKSEDELKVFETKLIKKRKPLINIKNNNSECLKEIKKDIKARRKICVDFANTKCSC